MKQPTKEQIQDSLKWINMKVLQLFNNIKIEVYDDEVEKILNGIKEKDQIIVLKNGVFNSSAFVSITDEEEEKNHNEGTLHDGTPVIRYFGSWYLDGEFDENGKPWRRIDQAHYPEVQRDVVPSRRVFEKKFKALPRKERLALMCEGTREPGVRGLKSVGGLMDGFVKRIEQKHKEEKNDQENNN